MRKHVQLVRRVGWNIVDQGLSALSNVVLSVIVARSVDARSFGAFAIAFLVYGIAVALSKSVVGEPLQMRFSAVTDDRRPRAIADALGFSLLLALGTSVLAVAVGSLSPTPLRDALLALAVVMPALLVQDTCRMAMFTLARPAWAAAIDAAWAVVQVLLLVGLIAAGKTGIGALVLAWGISAAVSAVLGLGLLRVLPRLAGGVRWLRHHWDLIRYLLPQYVFGLGASQVAILLVGVVATASAVGSLRAAQVLLGPLSVLGVGAFQFAVPEIARRTTMSYGARVRFAVAVSAALGIAVTGYVSVLLLLPDSIGVALFGDSWAGAASVLVAMGVSSLASSLAVGPMAVLYGMGEARVIFWISAVKGPVVIVAVLLATWSAGAVGAAWALTVVEIAVLLPSWYAMRRVLRGMSTPEDAPLREGVLS